MGSRDKHPEQAGDIGNTESTSIPELDNPITEKEVRDTIAHLKSGKAAGLDEISGEMLKHAIDFAAPFLTRLFNRLYDTGTFPSDWAKSIIVPLLKKR